MNRTMKSNKLAKRALKKDELLVFSRTVNNAFRAVLRYNYHLFVSTSYIELNLDTDKQISFSYLLNREFVPDTRRNMPESDSFTTVTSFNVFIETIPEKTEGQRIFKFKIETQREDSVLGVLFKVLERMIPAVKIGDPKTLSFFLRNEINKVINRAFEPEV